MNKPLTKQEPDQHQLKKAYHTPVVKRYGSLTELVQFRPDRGRDAETRWIDCTQSG